MVDQPDIADDGQCRGDYAGAMLRTAALILAVALAAAIHPDEAEAQLRCRAVDGDTLAYGVERVRVIGLDAPEMHGRCPAETRLARSARDRMGLTAWSMRAAPIGAAAVVSKDGITRTAPARTRRSMASAAAWCGRGSPCRARAPRKSSIPATVRSGARCESCRRR